MKVNLSITGTNSSFNLNLLECKYFSTLKRYSVSHVLISTYWNVNLICKGFKMAINGFNLNLKYKSGYSVKSAILRV